MSLHPIDLKGQHSWLMEYISKCRSGEITVGHELKQTFDILDDHLNNPDIRFELEDAHKRIRFIETKCRHFDAPFAGKPFILELFQKAVVEALYSFKIFDDELGRWRRMIQDLLYVVGRKNGKTPFISALSLAEWFCGNEGTKILCSSNDYEQADLMFQAINNMREENPSLERVTRKNIKGIYFGNPRKPKKRGKFSYQNKGSIRKISAKTGAKEGRNIAVGAVDEVHELKDESSTMPIRQALSTQDEPLYYELTTEGFTADGYLDKRLIEARKVLSGELERPDWLIWLYTQDNEAEVWQDESSWVKSNPGLGTIKKWSFLRKMIEESKTNTARRAFVLAKDFNIKQNDSNAWLLEGEYSNDETYDISCLRGSVGFAGVDLSETTDLTCAHVVVMRPGSPKKTVISKYFMPEAKLAETSTDNGSNYKEWAKQGLITVCPGNENDYGLITRWFIEIIQKYKINVFKVGYDNWNAYGWIKEMKEMGFDCDRVRWEPTVLSNPMNLLEADLRSKLVNYNNNPVTKWCLGNTGVKVNSRAEIMPIKMERTRRIDGTAALIIAYCVYQRYRNEYLDIVR